jgi:hypothetical protein
MLVIMPLLRSPPDRNAPVGAGKCPAGGTVMAHAKDYHCQQDDSRASTKGDFAISVISTVVWLV